MQLQLQSDFVSSNFVIILYVSLISTLRAIVCPHLRSQEIEI
jgi:hypothetical protein